MCAEQEFVVGNSWFKKNDVYKYTWARMAEGRVVDRASMYYVLSPKRMRGKLLAVIKRLLKLGKKLSNW